MSRFRVEKCICHKRSFKEISELAEAEDLNSVQDLQRRDICSNGCGLCIPYVEMMMDTGKVSFVPGEPYKRKTG